MRALSCALSIGVVWATTLSGQQPARTTAPGGMLLTGPERIAVVNTILLAREGMYGQDALINGCRLRAFAGLTNDEVVRQLSAVFRPKLFDLGAVDCSATKSPPHDAKIVVLEFQSIRAEQNEWIAAVGSTASRPRGLVVVRVSVHGPGGGSARLEEWVLGRLLADHWQVTTIRTFMIGSS